MSAMQALSAKVTATQAEEMVKELDVTSKGAIQLPQFIVLMERHTQSSGAEQELIDAFRVFDTRGNGRLKASELRHILTNLGEKLSEEEVEELIREVDVDGDGEILCNEFASIMLARG
ncbi:calmodulin [Dunaliella salina]|uniref:Calmodulin n=1 Tax=Dunaliella salina TaxID=3046 RepID=A0ABQ7GFX8_DUNSA|nr:calmodulin [Dunaliella salina]|eukprot:KAF5833503.1 calmodulin [Dunaliella salina]